MKKTAADSGTQSSPLAEPKFISEEGLTSKPISSLKLLNLNAGRAAILHYFENTWALTETLFSALTSDEAYYLRPYHKTRHPLIFYYTHPVTFYINKLIVAGLITEPVNKHFEFLFETGVDEMSWDDLHEGDQSIWPALQEVVDYRQQVFQIVRNLIQTHPIFDKPITMDSPGWALVMCFEHERIHLETSSVLMRELPAHYVKTPVHWPQVMLRDDVQPNTKPVAGVHFPAENPLIGVAQSSVRLGKPRAWPSFGWDNEYGEDKRQTAAFKASQRLISNGEFYEFVASGAYLDEQYWSKDGWGWRRFRNTRWPSFWVQDGPVGSHQFKLRTTFSVEDMQWDWPAVVNFYEAKAYCAWRSTRDGVKTPYRLLQESEHLAIREPALQNAFDWQPGKEPLLDLDRVMADEAELAAGYEVNNNLHFGSESPVDRFAPNSLGFNDVFGNLWQWCEDTFHPLPGFRIHPYYVDFSTPCFDDQHQMILGGSFISTGDEASMWSRFHFRPHFFQHAGFRIVQSEETTAQKKDRYESDALLNQYMLFHWGSEAEQRDEEITSRVGHPQVQQFVPATVALVNHFAAARSRVLDLGCAVGRASFELARTFNEVIGLDYSQAFIDAANTLKAEGRLEYVRHDSGRFSSALCALVNTAIDRERVEFVNGDASDLRASEWQKQSQDRLQGRMQAVMQGFDAALLSNLLCRLPDPAACLRQFVHDDKLLNKNGVLVLCSPNSWMEQYTPSENFIDGDSNATALAKLGAILEGFELIHEEDLPFMIREHRRKYEYIVSQVSVWRKR
ncbi:MAG: 5-histidylcysteine sulfoxide synthase [Gammaproteobacteria bacterium]|nr:5-histidylcysteine sulfoxide synthase [Gammaproteobacteria bacterium]MDP2139515.1 5-histidylcysteine sulfoxide synthase [Gammaproteobacteria bacterium]MDP2348470.1 5-histidylcysteine sulfoxide synthase [Gammaproteobacteria bacterium]